MSTAPSGPVARPATPRPGLVPAILAGIAVVVVLGVYAGVHEPAGGALSVPGFTSQSAMKSWLSTSAMALVLVQVLTAAGMWGRLGASAPAWSAPVHRWSGRLAMLVMTVVAVHCLFAFGFSDRSARTVVHSLLGCFVFGVFTTKMLALTRPGLPGWALPALGGVLTAGFALAWVTSAWWFFTTFGLGR